MEASQWVIAVSTAIIAIIFLGFAIWAIRVGLVLKKDVHLLTDQLEQKIQSMDQSWRNFLSLDASYSKEEPNKSRILPKILYGCVFATTLWKNLQKRR